jgi:2-hydroxy-3-keto-5-methylthiopentenyl-1-phosphate phosphatase
MLKPPLHIFTDFDGTITREDLGDKIFKVFGNFDEYYPRLQRGELTVPEYWHLLCASISPSTTLAEMRSWAHEQAADPYFATFVQFCRENALPLTVVSDGFDVYIDTVLQRELAAQTVHPPRFCNELRFQNGAYTPFFPGRDESCSCFCASCKRNAVLCNTPPDALVIYIGDGYSDFCAADHADIIFAKKSLAAYCNKNRLPHYPFSSFADVQAIIAGLNVRRRLRPRHQAVLRRKEAFEIE